MSKSAVVEENGLGSAPLVKLHKRLMISRHAIKSAGLRSGRFKPKGQTMLIDVIIPIEIKEWDLSEEKLADVIRGRVVEKCAAKKAVKKK